MAKSTPNAYIRLTLTQIYVGTVNLNHWTWTAGWLT